MRKIVCYSNSHLSIYLHEFEHHVTVLKKAKRIILAMVSYKTAGSISQMKCLNLKIKIRKAILVLTSRLFKSKN